MSKKDKLMNTFIGIAISFSPVALGLYPVWKTKQRRKIEQLERDFPEFTNL